LAISKPRAARVQRGRAARPRRADGAHHYALARRT